MSAPAASEAVAPRPQAAKALAAPAERDSAREASREAPGEAKRDVPATSGGAVGFAAPAPATERPLPGTAQACVTELEALVRDARLADARALLPRCRERYPDATIPGAVLRAIEPGTTR